MPAVIALITGIIIFAVFLVGVVWALFILVPFYAYVGVSVFLIWRSAQKQAELVAAIQREARIQRSFKDQGMRAWTASIEKR
ncbi:hypothetical protein UB31_35485 [Bradyrhizobium sp. LTSP849]|nr:hypothetical protein UB31_35485 [Bradyrhizobium sp. LTSP849]